MKMIAAHTYKILGDDADSVELGPLHYLNPDHIVAALKIKEAPDYVVLIMSNNRTYMFSGTVEEIEAAINGKKLKR